MSTPRQRVLAALAHEQPEATPYGSADDVAAEVKWICETIGQDGGYVCAPAHSIPADVPAENIAAVIETQRAQATS